MIKGRRGRILSEELREGMDLFVVKAFMPVEACLASQRGDPAAPRDQAPRETRPEQRTVWSFADEIRRETSGAASVSLVLSHWERLQVCAGRTPATALLKRVPARSLAVAVVLHDSHETVQLLTCAVL